MPGPRTQDNHQWWDRESDDAGVRIRPDVHRAAQENWAEARNRVRVALGDTAEAAELMEATVVHISHYLDHYHIPLFTADNVSSLLMLHFRQELARRVGKLRRTESIAEQEADRFPAPRDNWDEVVNRRVDLQRLCLLLSKRSCAIMSMRLLGQSWEKIAEALGISPYKARTGFCAMSVKPKRKCEADRIQ